MKVKRGKHTVNVPLSASGKSAIGGCSITGLIARFVKGKKEEEGQEERAGSPSPLSIAMRQCAALGSENPTTRPYYGPAIDTSNADRCDFMDPTVCLQPWPNDYFTKADATTDTGRPARTSTRARRRPTSTAFT